MYVLRLKIKQSSYSFLRRSATEANIAWNQLNTIYYNNIQNKIFQTHFDLNKMTTAWAKTYFNDTMQMSISCLAREIVTRSKQFKKRLRDRRNFGSKKALGWIPFTADCLRKNGEMGLKFKGHSIRVHEAHKLIELTSHKHWRDSCFVEDSCGDWWLCLTIDKNKIWQQPTEHALGMDIGLKTTATCSNGNAIFTDFYRNNEIEIKKLQKARRKQQLRKLHRKIARKRKHALHVFSTNIVKNYKNIFIGNVAFEFLKSGKKAKSAYDGGIGILKEILMYKGQQAGRCVEIVDEKYTTQTCSACGCLSGPAGSNMLVVRNWICSECKTEHSNIGNANGRDINAAINICTYGLKMLQFRDEASSSVCRKKQKLNTAVLSGITPSIKHGLAVV